MPRRARTYATYATYATHAVLALALAGALTACTDSSGSEEEGADKPGGPSTSASAAPGKYRTLPEPCGTVNLNTLKGMLPGAAAEEEGEPDPDPETAEASPSPYEGEASVTYDTDRRSGCRWKSATTLSTRHLNVDFERVVSYDPAVSDDEQAERLYDRKASKAEIPVPPDSSGEDGGDGDGDGDGDQTQEESQGGNGEDGAEPKGESSPHGGASPSEDTPSKDGSPDPDGPGDSGDSGDSEGSENPEDSEKDSSSPDTDEDLAPRTLDDIGDTAYINDKLDTGDSGLHRDITLVFRTANVIATIEYDQWVTDKHRIPDSRELQDKARKLAEQLATQFEEE